MAAQANEMTFWDHLDVLRKSIFRFAAVYVIVAAVLFFFKDFLFDQVILAPTDKNFYLYRLLGLDFSLSLVNIEKVGITSMIFGALAVFLPQFIVVMFFKTKGQGGADFKFSTSAALCLGFYGGVIGYMIGLVFAIVFQTIYNKIKKQSNKEAFPLLPFISTGLMIGYFI